MDAPVASSRRCNWRAAGSTRYVRTSASAIAAPTAYAQPRDGPRTCSTDPATSSTRRTSWQPCASNTIAVDPATNPDGSPTAAVASPRASGALSVVCASRPETYQIVTPPSGDGAIGGKYRISEPD